MVYLQRVSFCENLDDTLRAMPVNRFNHRAMNSIEDRFVLDQ